MQFKIGVFGSAATESDEIAEKARLVGHYLGINKAIIITGACSGLPYIAALAAFKNSAEIWGYSPVLNEAAQKNFTPNDNLKIYKKLTYIPESFAFNNDILVCKKYRNVISTANCDAGIIIAGRWGTLNEFTNLIDMGKIIGVLTETVGIANELQQLTYNVSKPTKAKIIFSKDPKKLVQLVINKLIERNN